MRLMLGTFAGACLWIGLLAAQEPASGWTDGSYIPESGDACLECDAFDASCSPACRGTWFAGAGAYVAQPVWEANPAVWSSTNTPQDDLFVRTKRDFEFDHEVSPLVWLGYVGDCGLGLRARFWEFEADDRLGVSRDSPLEFQQSAMPGGFRLVANGVGDTIDVAADLDAEVWDLELLQRLHTCYVDLEYSAGVRRVRLHQRYSGLLDSAANGAGIDEMLTSRSRFEGVGPTLALQLDRGLGQTGFSLYCVSRGSLLWGVGRQVSAYHHPMQFFPFRRQDRVQYRHDDLLPIVEIELGGEYRRCVAAAEGYARLGMAAQAWLGAGNSSHSEEPTSGAGDASSNLGFVGLTVEAGLEY